MSIIMKHNRLLANQFSFSSLVQYQNPNPFIEKVILNSPKTLNAINYEMIQSLTQRYKQNWNGNNQIKMLLFSGNGGKAFSAGGDVKSLYEDKINPDSDKQLLKNFFLEEHSLDHYISQLKQTQVSIWDGIVMGGGVGISIFSKFKIATEKSMFAMPEAKIGFITDIGASYFLSRLQNNLGLYLGLTGQRLKGQQLVQAGLAQYYIKQENLLKLEEEFIQNINEQSDENHIKSILEKYSEKVEQKFENEEQIKELFDSRSFDTFYNSLKQNQSEISQKILKDIESQSPLSVRVIFEQINKGRNLNVEQCFTMDLNLCSKFMQESEFFEGVRCLLVDRTDKPKWIYNHVLDINNEIVDKYFQNHDIRLNQ